MLQSAINSEYKNVLVTVTNQIRPTVCIKTLTHVWSTRDNYKDLHRLLALKNKNNEIFRDSEGLMARYGGYVPGGKFRHSDTFARLTQDAKGMTKTSTYDFEMSAK